MSFMRVYENAVDRTGWDPGPWDGEPDKIEWVDEASDLDCLVVRHAEMGNWCGYVGVPNGHALYGKDRGDVDLRAHGGVNFSAPCQELGEGDDPANNVCHVPEPGRTGDVWWFGFDCAHHMDLSPGVVARTREFSPLLGERLAALLAHGVAYRTVDYVMQECARLAQQLVAVVGDQDPPGFTVGGVTLTPEQVAELLSEGGVNPMMLIEAMASVALSRDPEGQTRAIPEVGEPAQGADGPDE